MLSLSGRVGMVPSVLAALKALALARKSSGAGSRYGQYELACMHQHGAAGLALDNGEAVSLYRLAALQQLDAAQRDLGFMFFKEWGVAEDHVEALRCYLAAAAQGDAAASITPVSATTQAAGQQWTSTPPSHFTPVRALRAA